MGWLSQMLCNWGSFSMICHWSHTDWEKLLHFYWVWGNNWEDCSGTWCLGGFIEKGVTGKEEGFRDVVSDMSNRSFLAKTDIMRESSSFCSKLPSTMRRLYLGVCEKTMLSLHFSEWLEWKCRSAAQSVSFLYSVVDSLWSAPIRIFMSRKDTSLGGVLEGELDCGVEVFHEVL